MDDFEKDFRSGIKRERLFYCSYDLANPFEAPKKIAEEIDIEPKYYSFFTSIPL
jgi:hypothetical protein